MTLGDRILKYRAQNNLSMAEFAKKAKISLQTVRNIEQGLQAPSRLTRAKILEVIGEEETYGHIGKQIEGF